MRFMYLLGEKVVNKKIGEFGTAVLSEIVHEVIVIVAPAMESPPPCICDGKKFWNLYHEKQAGHVKLFKVLSRPSNERKEKDL